MIVSTTPEETVTTQQPYAAKEFNLSGLNGISDRTLEMHFALYKGYVKNTNLLGEELTERSQGKN